MRHRVKQSARFAGITGTTWGLMLCALLLLPVKPSRAQIGTAMTGLPERAPGYELYYHTDKAPNAFATRWGYLDGWRDGKHDSELGRPLVPTEQDRYKLAPDHGMHPDISRVTYKNIYRTAYLHGYEQGSNTAPIK